MVEAFSAMLTGSCLEDDLADLRWSFVNLFHRKVDRIERELDVNEQAQRRGQAEQDGSEVKSVELERLIAQGLSLIERRNAFEFVRDHAAEPVRGRDRFRLAAAQRIHGQSPRAHRLGDRQPGIHRRPPSRRRELLAPAGARIAFTGGTDCNDHDAVWAALDKVRAKHADMVLLHGGSPRGAERIPACWADTRKVAQVVFKPDWVREGRAAPFKRNGRLLEALPIGVIVFPGSGISANLADKAKKLGISVWRFDKPAAATTASGDA